MTMERRALDAPFEFRADSDGLVRVTGYAAVFNQPADIGGQFDEIIEPGAFRSALTRGDDIVFLVNHDGLPLARRSAGNLELSEDSHGLRMEATLDPSDPDVARIVPKLRNKLLKAMSFTFKANQSGQRWSANERGKSVRRLNDFAYVGDVSVVTSPAYEGTEIALRSRDAAIAAEPEDRSGLDLFLSRSNMDVRIRKAKKSRN